MSNNSTESMISSILQDESQFGMCAIMYNKRRFREATMTNFVFSEGMGFISRNDKLINRDWLILKPFPTIIWIFILAVFIVIISVMNIADRYHPTDKNGKYNLWKFERTTRLIGIFLNQSVNTWKERGNSSRLKYGVWMFSTLILSTNYNSIFYSLLTLPQYERPIDTVNDLMESIKDDSHTIWTQSNYEYLRRMFQRSPPQFKVLHEIGKHMTRTNSKTFEDEFQMISTVKRDPTNIVVGPRYLLHILKQMLAPEAALHVGSGNVFQTNVVIPLAKRSPLIEPFNFRLRQIFESGILDSWLENAIIDALTRKFMFNFFSTKVDLKKSASDENSSQIKSLELDNFKSLYIIWLSGNAIGLLFFFIEIFVYSFSKKKVSVYNYINYRKT
ncbi:hypothetical protein BLOT_008483 [Blomia tropicalis]|nr:hypothetical protein BLOT_008483 [Blomia tropicalis]